MLLINHTPTHNLRNLIHRTATALADWASTGDPETAALQQPQATSPRVIQRREAFVSDVELMISDRVREEEIAKRKGYRNYPALRKQLERIGRRDLVLRMMRERGTKPLKPRGSRKGGSPCVS